MPAAPRPETFAEFVGQGKVVQNLRAFAEAARTRGEALDHVLLSGPPGVGKTTLAGVLAREAGVEMRTTAGPLLSRPGDLAAVLAELPPRAVLLIDEVHRLQAGVGELLHPAMEDFRLDILTGSGPTARALRISVNPFTLVGATTRAGLVARPLRERFGIPLRLDFYGPGEIAEILARRAEAMGFPLSAAAADEIARRSRGTPRAAGRLLRRVRDLAGPEGAGGPGGAARAADALARLGIDEAGLDALDRRLLSFLAEAHGGGPAGVETLSAALSESRDSIEEAVEPFLIRLGLLRRTRAGRVLSPAAWARLGLEPPPAAPGTPEAPPAAPGLLPPEEDGDDDGGDGGPLP